MYIYSCRYTYMRRMHAVSCGAIRRDRIRRMRARYVRTTRTMDTTGRTWHGTQRITTQLNTNTPIARNETARCFRTPKEAPVCMGCMIRSVQVKRTNEARRTTPGTHDTSRQHDSQSRQSHTHRNGDRLVVGAKRARARRHQHCDVHQTKARPDRPTRCASSVAAADGRGSR